LAADCPRVVADKIMDLCGVPTVSGNEKSLCQREAMAEAMKVPMCPGRKNPKRRPN